MSCLVLSQHTDVRIIVFNKCLTKTSAEHLNPQMFQYWNVHELTRFWGFLAKAQIGTNSRPTGNILRGEFYRSVFGPACGDISMLDVNAFVFLIPTVSMKSHRQFTQIFFAGLSRRSARDHTILSRSALFYRPLNRGGKEVGLTA